MKPTSIKIIEKLRAAGFEAYWAGGCVRDILMGHEPKDYDDLKQIVTDGWAFSYWCESRECEAKVKEDTKATTRNIPFNQPTEEGICIVCGKPSKRKVYFAKAY